MNVVAVVTATIAITVRRTLFLIDVEEADGHSKSVEK
jgi:hypothetical protein